MTWPHFAHGIAYELRRIRKQPLSRVAVKVIGRCLGVALWFLLLPVTLVLHVLGYRRVTVFTDRIGHLALEPDCLIKEQMLGLTPRRRWFIIASPGRVANRHLLNYWRRFIRVYENPLSCFILGNMSRWGLMRHDISHHILATNKSQAAYDIYTRWQDRPPLLTLTVADANASLQALQQLGLPSGAWFVCVHVREAGFSPVDEELHAHRNGCIEATIPAIQEITRRGGWVIRIGDPTMTQLPSLPQVIDYARHPMKNEQLDIILCARARFILGNTSGIALVGTIFGTPCALANVIPVSTLWFNPYDISISKLLWSERLGRYLSFDEAMALPIANYRYAVLYEEAGIRVEDNSADDIRDLVIEMINRLDKTFVERQEDQELSRRFQTLLRENHYGYGSCARVGALFLRNHADLLERLPISRPASTAGESA